MWDRDTTCEGGFTLAEVLVALFLIGIGVLAAAPMFMYAMQGTAVGGLADHVAMRFEELGKDLPQHAVVVGKQHAGTRHLATSASDEEAASVRDAACVAAAIGTRASTRVPPHG